MPAKVKVKILSCRNLPVMDRSNLTTDAFVEVKLGQITYKTDVKRKTLHPVFNSNWFRFEIDDTEIQDELLSIRVMDYDTYSANDAIGKVCLNLNPLLLQNDTKGFNGCYPIFDTMQGIRGEINFIVKVELFTDSNKYKTSSCGIQFFHSNSIPYGYHAVIRGFVEEMIVDDDPEHDWFDKIRKASVSNEARQQTFMKLAGQIQRKIGLKAISLGGNSVLGFQQRFDLEKDTIIARGIGTCVTLVKIQSDPLSAGVNVQNIPEDEKSKSFLKHSTRYDLNLVKMCLETLAEESKDTLRAEHSKSLLSVPSIYIDNLDTSSTVSSTPGDTSSTGDERSVSDMETVSMIVRNVEAMERALNESNISTDVGGSPKNIEAVKVKHDFIHDLKGKFHHLADNIKRHDTPHSQTKEYFHGLRENVSGKFHQIAERIHHIHFPQMHHSHAHEESLIQQAMQTILLEKFNIVEASTSVQQQQQNDALLKRKSSSSSLQSIKQKFNLFQRPRRSVDLSGETSNLKSISEINQEKSAALAPVVHDNVTIDDDDSSLSELQMHEEVQSESSFDSAITVLKAMSKEDLKLSPGGSMNEMLSASPNVKSHTRTESIGCKFSASPSKQHPHTSGSLPGRDAATAIYRRSSDSDLSITPKGNSLTPGFDRTIKLPSAVLKPLNQECVEMLEYPFLTLSKYPPGFIIHLGATVSARSVKLLDKSTNEEMETRDSWFNELRMEIRGHAKAVGCNVVLGYTETVCVNDDVTVLSASGTAAVINLHHSDVLNDDDIELKVMKSANPKELLLTTSIEETLQTQEESAQKIIITSESDAKKNGEDVIVNDLLNVSANTSGSSGFFAQNQCTLCHIPYSRSSIHIGGVNIGKCCICKRGYVPDVLLATIELPDGLPVVGNGCLLQATVCRPKRDLRSESNAKEISDGLPFLEYELHRLLINKLKVKGMNAIFRLSVQVTIGDKIMSLIATGTAVFLSALHPPIVPKIVAGNSFNESSEKLAELQKKIQTTVEKNRETYQLHNQPEMSIVPVDVQKLNKNFSDTDDSDNEEKLDYAVGNKQTCMLEIDDIQDLELFNMLMEQCSPEGINIVNAQNFPGIDHNADNLRNLQMFVQVWRTKMPSSHQSNSNFARHFQRLLQSIFFKLRGAIPCYICNIQFQLDLPADEIQLLITGMVLKTAAKGKSKLVQSISHDKKFEDELMFSLEEEDTVSEITSPQSKTQKKGSSQFNNQAKMTCRNDKFVDISPLSWLPGGKVEKYLGNVNFCFIRETQNVREFGGICGFVHSFITELLAIVRSHISCLGGNMMLAFYMTELILIDNPHKNQAQCLINAGGDAVYCTYNDDN